jgi:hypothetical protein
VIVLDTGPLVAAGLVRDRHHRECVDLFTAAHLAGEALVVPTPVVTEVGYLLAREGGTRLEAAFVDNLADGDFQLAEPDPSDWRRAAALMRQYDDLSLGIVDATVIAVAERLGATDVATLDRRHFAVVRPRHVPAFTLLPELRI